MKVVVAKTQKEILDNCYVRGQVFIVEQKIDWAIEFDGLDPYSVLFTAYIDNKPVGAARLYEKKVGRVATLQEYRKQGVATQLMKHIEEYAKEQNMTELILHAQKYIEDFYTNLGYTSEGGIFYEADIPHVKMRKDFLQQDTKKKAIDSFNKTWDMIDKEIRTKEDNKTMIEQALLSRKFWEQANGSMLNIVRADWLISHVCSILGDGKNALKYAKTCYGLTLQYNIDDFDLVFAYEAMAYAYKVLNEIDNMNNYLTLGYRAIDQVKKQGDKDYCRYQLDNIKN
jgi:predicted GNAT family N-acyltransferase